MSEAIHLFSSGSQYLDWTAANCDRCEKYNPESTAPEEGCDIEWAISIASISDGTVTPEIAHRCGLTGNEDRYQWNCPEMVWTREAADKRAKDFDCVDFAAFARAYPARAALVRVEEPFVENEAARMRVLGPEVAPMLPGVPQ